MTRKEIETIVSNAFRMRTEKVDFPSAEDWKKLQRTFGCEFPSDYICLVELMSEYWFEGDFLSPRRQPDSDGIIDTYEAELETGRDWDRDLIPIIGIGNGDYVCLRASECPGSAVYYIYHEDDLIEHLHESIADFICDPNWIGN